jgi:RNA polymerase sigma factor (sigma-70 family)
LYEEFGRPGRQSRETLILYIQGKTLNEAATLDIESTLWFRVCQHEQGWTGRAPAKSWLYTVARNLVIDYMRGCKTDPLAKCAVVRDTDREDEDEDGEWQDSLTPVDPAASPYESLSHAQEDAKVSDLLMLVAPLYRTVLKRRVEGDTLAEIAEDLDMPLSAVKARFYRGKTKLLAAIQS